VVYRSLAGVTAPTDKPTIMEALARKYALIFMLNVDEVYWPSSVDIFLAHDHHPETGREEFSG